MNNKRRPVDNYIALLLSVAVIAAASYLLFSTAGEDSGFIEEVNSKAVSANILLLNEIETPEYISFTGGQSGAIIKKENGKYYALTALHGVPAGPGADETKLLVLGYDQPLYREAEVNMGLKAYYAQFPEAAVEYYDSAYDLAVISFKSMNDYAVLPIASEPPEYKETVAVIGNPGSGERNTVVTGKITSRKPAPFSGKEDGGQSIIIQNSAKTSGGFSGGALVNEDLELVGIHLGAMVNIFDQFKSSCAVPSDKILEFLAGWRKSYTI